MILEVVVVYLIINHLCSFLPSTTVIVDVIYGWSLRQMYIDDIKMWAQFCKELIDFQSCNLGVCPESTASPNVIDSKYNTMDCQWAQLQFFISKFPHSL